MVGDSLFTATRKTESKKMAAEYRATVDEFSSLTQTRIASGKWDYPRFREEGIKKGVPLDMIERLWVDGRKAQEKEMVRTMGKLDPDVISDIYTFGQIHDKYSFDDQEGGYIAFGQGGVVFNIDTSTELINSSKHFDDDGNLAKGSTVAEGAKAILDGYNNGHAYALETDEYERDMWVSVGTIDGKVEYELQTIKFKTKNFKDIVGVKVPKTDTNGNLIPGEYTMGNARTTARTTRERTEGMYVPSHLPQPFSEKDKPAEKINDSTKLKYNISGNSEVSTEVPVKYIKLLDQFKIKSAYPAIQKVSVGDDKVAVKRLRNLITSSDSKLLSIMNESKSKPEEIRDAWLDRRMDNFINESRAAFGLIEHGYDINLWRTK